MPLTDQVSLLLGEDFLSLPAIERLELNKLRMTDGPNGVGGGGSLTCDVTAAAFSVGDMGHRIGVRGELKGCACVARANRQHTSFGDERSQFRVLFRRP